MFLCGSVPPVPAGLGPSGVPGLGSESTLTGPHADLASALSHHVLCPGRTSSLPEPQRIALCRVGWGTFNSLARCHAGPRGPSGLLVVLQVGQDPAARNQEAEEYGREPGGLLLGRKCVRGSERCSLPRLWMWVSGQQLGADLLTCAWASPAFPSRGRAVTVLPVTLAQGPRPCLSGLHQWHPPGFLLA